jgi:DNA adenine methylase
VRETLDGIKGKFILSLNDHPEVRRIFSGFVIQKVSLKYSIGRSTASREKTRDEVIIQNFD